MKLRLTLRVEEKYATRYDKWEAGSKYGFAEGQSDYALLKDQEGRCFYLCHGRSDGATYGTLSGAFGTLGLGSLGPAPFRPLAPASPRGRHRRVVQPVGPPFTLGDRPSWVRTHGPHPTAAPSVGSLAWLVRKPWLVQAHPNDQSKHIPKYTVPP